MSKRQSRPASELLSRAITVCAKVGASVEIRPTEPPRAIQPLRVEPARRRALAPHPSTVAAVWFDYTDLIHYFGGNRMPTGIQRVQIELLRAASHQPVPSLRPLGCAFIPARGGWVAVPESLFAGICEAACDSSPESGWLANIETFSQAMARAPLASFAPGDVLVNIGSSWWIPDYMTHIRYMQRERGLLYAPYFHDCIPIRAAETCAAGLVTEFRSWFPQAVGTADLVLANSDCTARDVVGVAREMTGRDVQAQVIRLDARFSDPLARLPEAAHARLRAGVRARLGLDKPFALFVSTIEARKNHIFVFECWAELIAELGFDAVPDLVCVGKQGWLVDYTLNWLAVHPELRGKIRLVGTLPDNDLAVLYGCAVFSVYCSFYEGWGLPITESLSHGKVTLVPDHSSLPEAGGDLVLYYEPGSREDFKAQFRRVADPDERALLEARIATEFRPRAWPEVLAQLLTTVREAPVLEHGGAGAPSLRGGRLYGFGRPLPHDTTFADGSTLRHGPGFWAAEDWGSWSSAGAARLMFAVEPDRAVSRLLYAVVRAGPEDTTVRVEVGASGGEVDRAATAPAPAAAA